jgi:hypothetical protein
VVLLHKFDDISVINSTQNEEVFKMYSGKYTRRGSQIPTATLMRARWTDLNDSNLTWGRAVYLFLCVTRTVHVELSPVQGVLQNVLQLTLRVT